MNWYNSMNMNWYNTLISTEYESYHLSMNYIRIRSEREVNAERIRSYGIFIANLTHKLLGADANDVRDITQRTERGGNSAGISEPQVTLLEQKVP